MVLRRRRLRRVMHRCTPAMVQSWKAGDAEGASRRRRLGEDFPCVRKVVLVLPRDREHVDEVAGFAVADAEGAEHLQGVGKNR
jgi:hypothetical protein